VSTATPPRQAPAPGQGPSTPTARRWIQRVRAASAAGSTGIGLVLIWIVLAFASPYFLTSKNILNILLQASVLAILAGGQTYALIAAEIDLSVGSVVALVGSVAAILMVTVGTPWPLAVLAALAVGVATGGTAGAFRTRFAIPTFVTTLALMGIARGIALVITNGESIYGLPRGFRWLGQGHIGPIPVPIVIALVVLTVLHLLLSRTTFGLNVYAVGGNAEAAGLAGVHVGRIRMIVMVLSGLCAAVGGVVLASRLGSGSGTVGEDLLLDSIAAVVIGGTSLMGGVGTITGTVIGVVLIASIRNGLVLLGVSAFWQMAAIGALILIAVFLDYLAKGSSRVAAS
jgi:ribose/xylose/arabinose/galactoside ABC-type transport system permease subunit